MFDLLNLEHPDLHKIYQKSLPQQNKAVNELLEKYSIDTDFILQTSVIYEIYLMRSGDLNVFNPDSIEGQDGMVQAVKATEKFDKAKIRVCEVALEVGSVVLFLDPDTHDFIGVFYLSP